MQRYFIDGTFNAENETIISGDSARHIIKVMRMSIGDQIVVVAEGVAYVTEIIELNENVYVKQTGETIASPEMPVQVTIACGLPKGDKLELIAQKATELGMFALMPFVAERSIVKWDEKKAKKNVERLQKIVLEAAEQSHRTHVPEVFQPHTFKQLLAAIAKYDAVFIADEEDAKLEQRTHFATKLEQFAKENGQTVLCIFGPEGGISRKEAEALRAVGAQTMSLGPRILRAETAPLYALSAISYQFE